MMCVIDKSSLIIEIVALKKVKIEFKSLQICKTATVFSFQLGPKITCITGSEISNTTTDKLSK